MQDQYSRTQLLLGAEAMEKLHHARVAVFGIGGVGGYTVEALARSGVGALDLIDDDKVCLTNLNRQIIATHQSVGRYKTEVMAERIHDINPDCVVHRHECFFLPETSAEFHFEEYDYVIDAVDTVTVSVAHCVLSLKHVVKRAIVRKDGLRPALANVTRTLVDTALLQHADLLPMLPANALDPRDACPGVHEL